MFIIFNREINKLEQKKSFKKVINLVELLMKSNLTTFVQQVDKIIQTWLADNF